MLSMSNPPSAPEDSLPDSLVTPAAPAQHDCPKETELSPRSPRHHSAHDQYLSQGDQEAPSPSRAESPTVSHQWSQPVSTFALKRSPTAPLEKLARTDDAYHPQLSERDSIFATHYLPSDSGANTPQLPPHTAPDNDRVHLIPALDGAPVHPSPLSKVSSLTVLTSTLPPWRLTSADILRCAPPPFCRTPIPNTCLSCALPSHPPISHQKKVYSLRGRAPLSSGPQCHWIK